MGSIPFCQLQFNWIPFDQFQFHITFINFNSIPIHNLSIPIPIYFYLLLEIPNHTLCPVEALNRTVKSGTGYSSHIFSRRGASFTLQIGVPGEMIKLMGDCRSDCYERYLDVSIPLRIRVMSIFAKSLPTSY